MRHLFLLKILFLSMIFFSLSGRALPTRPNAAGVGFGLPEMVFLELQGAAFWRCQLGGTYARAWVPNVLPKGIKAPEQNITLSTGDAFALNPLIDPYFRVLSPFIRFFPDADNNFYLQFMWAWLKIDADFYGNLDPVNNLALPSIPITGTVTIHQYLPTVSVGYFFSSQIYYLNLNIGIGYMLDPVTNTIINTTIPDALGGNLNNQTQIDQLNASIQVSVDNSTVEIRKQFGIFPSLHLSFGIYF